METANLQVKFSNGTTTKTVTYYSVNVSSTDAQINAFVNFLLTLTAEGTIVVSKTKVIRHTIE